jgi:branched-chain amino acid transport system permease protein
VTNLKLRRDTPAMRLLFSIGAAALVLIVTQFLLPGPKGGSRGTPMAIVFTGVVAGALNGLTAIGLVLVYRTSRIVNFAQAALGSLGAIFAYNMIAVYNLPYGLALVTAVVVSAGFSALIELFLRRFFNAARLILTILTIGIATVLSTIGVPVIASLPIWGESRDLATTFGGTQIFPARDFVFHIGDLDLPFRLGHLLAIVMLVVVLAVVTAFLRFTRLGTAVRASAENTERAELLGINVRVLSTIVWTIAGAISAISLTLLGTIQNFTVTGRGGPTVLIAALAAAVIARMRSIPIAVWSAVLISIVQAAVVWTYRDQGLLVEAALFLVIALGLLIQRTTLVRAEEATSWEATEEVRPTPRELLEVGGLRRWRWVLVGVVGILVLTFPFMTTSDVVNRGSFAAILAIVFVSLVVLTGWAGQVSLGQFGLVAIGALTAGAITSRAGLSFWLAVPIAGIVTAVVALAIGLPALRIRGLFLGVVTLAFANAVFLVLFSDRYFEWLQPENIRRPTLLLLDFEDERSMYYLCLAFLVLVIVIVSTLRRSRPGRLMIALRENELELQSFGVNVMRTKLASFALSGFIVGVAGALYAHHQRAVDQLAFTSQASIDTFVFAIIGGIGSITGALMGAGFQIMYEFLPKEDPIIAFLINPGIGLLVVLYIAPGGLAGMIYAVRDSILRVVAQRRQLVVPSLFADVDPAVLEQQLIPLGEPAERTGLGALGSRSRYRLRESRYKEADVVVGEGAPDERALLGEVAERVGSES